MNSNLREQAVSLRIDQQLSYGDIRRRLGIPKSTLSYWLRTFPLDARRILELRRLGWRKGEASRERFRATMARKRANQFEASYQQEAVRFTQLPEIARYTAGLALYMAEGDKKNDYRIALANTDHRLIKFFMRWLSEFFRVDTREIKVQLHLYETMNIRREQVFWKKTLGLVDTQFYKPQVRKLREHSFTYRDSPHGSRHGTCSIFVLGVERKRTIMASVQAFVDCCITTEAGT